MANLEGVKVGDVLRVLSNLNKAYSRSLTVTRVTKCYAFTRNGERYPISDGVTTFYTAEREATDENA